MRAFFYRIASGLLVLFAAGHTLGFLKPLATPGAETVAALMKSTRFSVQGFDRTYWDFYVGFGLFVTVFLLFAAALTWQLGGLSPDAFSKIPGTATWGLAACFAVITVMTWIYFFVVPGAFSTVITSCLFAAPWFSKKL